MSRKITVLTADERLKRKIALLLRGSSQLCDEGEAYIIDRDTVSERREGAIYLSRTEDRCIRIPFAHAELVGAVEELCTRGRGRLVLGENGTVTLGGEEVRLTDAEYRTLSVLMRAPLGQYVSRETLLSEVFGEGTDAGSVNVYIYYLRKKLERGGERIILSSRSEGYKINEGYRR